MLADSFRETVTIFPVTRKTVTLRNVTLATYLKAVKRNCTVMKRINGLRVSMGLKQWEMAALLGISREHYAMFESGRRNLPASASQIYSALVMMHLEIDAKPVKLTAPDEDHSALIEGMLKENQFQQKIAEKKLASLKGKLELQQKRNQLARALNSADGNKKIGIQLPVVERQGTPKHIEDVFRLQIRLQLLKYEELLLKKTGVSGVAGGSE